MADHLYYRRLTLIKVVAIFIFFIVAIVIDTGGIG
jgi:amino acid permease